MELIAKWKQHAYVFEVGADTSESTIDRLVFLTI